MTSANGSSGVGLVAKARQEFIEYMFNVLYLTVVFASFTIYRRLVLAAHDIVYTNYWFALIEALVLGKVIMVGGVFRLGRGLEHKPLIYPTIYKTVLFTILVAGFKVVEHAIKGLWTGVGVAGGLAEFAERGFHIILANGIVVFVALLPFFAIKELGRVIGRERIAGLFFRRRSTT